MEKSFLALLVVTASFIQDAVCQTHFKTHEGCNATFVCYFSPGASVNWTNSLGPLSEGVKLKISTEPFYSALTMTGLTTADQGNISCIRDQHDTLRFTLEVQSVPSCVDKHDTATCKAQVIAGDMCTNSWMKEFCTKSCGLCPKTNCTSEQQATAPPTPISTLEPTTSGSSTSPSTETPENKKTNYSTSISNLCYSWHHLIILITQLFVLWVTAS